MKGQARVLSYLGHEPEWLPLSPVVMAKPDLCALVETGEAGRKVIWLSEGFPVDRSRYGRIALKRVTTGKA